MEDPNRPLTQAEIAEYETTMRPALRLQTPTTLHWLEYCRELMKNPPQHLNCCGAR